MTLYLQFRFGAEARLFFESLSYIIGFRIYLQSRKRSGDVVTTGQRRLLAAAAITFLLNGACAALVFGNPDFR
ncbi:MAG TPA: hypothetical protein VJ810_19535 [Blastocatellia bacterium]|nr:hypothetical protein [Blastocatellia bacterium]